MQRKMVELETGPVSYIQFGDRGVGVLCVHGLAGSINTWADMAPLLHQRGHRVLALDLPGHGRSAAPDRRVDVPLLRDSLAEFITAMKMEQVVLVGNSMGGTLSILSAAADPDKVAGVVLVDAALPLLEDGPFDPEVVAIFSGYLSDVDGAQTMRRWEQGGSEALVRATLQLVFGDPTRISRDLVARHVQDLESRSDHRAATRAVVEAAGSLVSMQMERESLRATMSRIQCPVLVLHGDRDRFIPIQAAQDASRRHPDWEFVALPGLGHCPPMENPALVAEHLDRWLRRTELSPTG